MDYTSESCEQSRLLSPAAILTDSHLSFHPYICQSQRPPYLPFPPHAYHFSFVSYIGSDSARRHLISIQLCAERVRCLAGVAFFCWTWQSYGIINYKGLALMLLRDSGPWSVSESTSLLGQQEANVSLKVMYCEAVWKANGQHLNKWGKTQAHILMGDLEECF